MDLVLLRSSRELTQKIISAITLASQLNGSIGIVHAIQLAPLLHSLKLYKELLPEIIVFTNVVLISIFTGMVLVPILAIPL